MLFVVYLYVAVLILVCLVFWILLLVFANSVAYILYNCPFKGLKIV